MAFAGRCSVEGITSCGCLPLEILRAVVGMGGVLSVDTSGSGSEGTDVEGRALSGPGGFDFGGCVKRCCVVSVDKEEGSSGSLGGCSPEFEPSIGAFGSPPSLGIGKFSLGSEEPGSEAGCVTATLGTRVSE